MDKRIYNSEIYKLTKFIRKMPNSHNIIKEFSTEVGIENEDALYHIISDMYKAHLKDIAYTNFIDYCSAPGIYSKYLLEKNKHAVGVGISLPPCKGGVEIHEEVSKRFKKRYTIEYTNIYDVPEKKYTPKYDLCLASCISYDKDADYISEYKIIFKSLLLCLMELEKDGTLIINFTFKDIIWTINILYLFTKLFDRIELFKSTNVWVLQRSFYVIGKKYTYKENIHKKFEDFYENIESVYEKWIVELFPEIEFKDVQYLMNMLELNVFVPQIKSYVIISTKDVL
jgi:hypothetical protein